MNEVARAAGVSVSTVSHVVNGTRPVAAATRERVAAAMEELGYSAGDASRSLAAGDRVTVGVAAPLSRSPFYQELLEGIAGEAERAGFAVLLADTGDDPIRERSVVAHLLAHHVQGLLVAPTAQWVEQSARMVLDRRTPCVLVDRGPDSGFDHVGVEAERGARRLVEHLLSSGHRRVGCIAGRAGLTTTVERVSGYRAAFAAAGLDVDESLVVDGDSTEQGGRRALRALWGMKGRPTAVFVGNDAMTTGVLRGARDLGIRMPEDLALVCFDDPPLADLVSPSLTALAQPAHAVGARAVQLLAARIVDPSIPVRMLRLDGEIAHRASCGCRRP